MNEIERQVNAVRAAGPRVLPASWFDADLAEDMALHLKRNAAGLVRSAAGR